MELHSEKEIYVISFVNQYSRTMIIGKDKIKMTYADMEITWTYGDQEDALENDE